MTPDPDLTTRDVLDGLRSSGRPLEQWGTATDGTPILSARIGGARQPPIFITAGAHCTETAGVHAALNLLEILETAHETHILPLRDPMGFAGVDRCLSAAAGTPVRAGDTREALRYLTEHGELLWADGEIRLFSLGRMGFIWSPPRPGLDAFWEMFGWMSRLPREAPTLLRPLLGRSIMLLNSTSEIEGADGMQRCYHTVLSTAGEWLHLNRFFGRPDAPPEVSAVDRFMQARRPGLTCDLHEGNGEGFWMPIPGVEAEKERLFEMTRAFFEQIHLRNYPVTTYENWLATDRTGAPDPNWMLPEPRLPGLFWLNGRLRGEGHNMMTYAGLFGLGYGTEGPMGRPLAMRADGLTHGIQAAIRVWESTVGTSERGRPNPFSGGCE